MALDDDPDVWRTRDGRAWRIGSNAQVAWIDENTTLGRAITSAIPPVFEAYATLEHPETGESETRPCEFEDWDCHVASVIAVLSEHTAARPWWLGYIEKGPATDIIFNDVPKVSNNIGWRYVLVEAGPEQAAAWRAADPEDPMPRDKDVLPDLMFPADRSWLFSTLWDDDWTCIGGPRELVDAVLKHPELRYRAREIKSLVEDATPPGHTAI
jgi:hypothetical protein